MAFIVVGAGFAGFLYTLFNPASVKAANKANNKKLGFGDKPIWFFRTLGAVGSIICGLLLLQIALWKSN